MFDPRGRSEIPEADLREENKLCVSPVLSVESSDFDTEGDFDREGMRSRFVKTVRRELADCL